MTTAETVQIFSRNSAEIIDIDTTQWYLEEGKNVFNLKSRTYGLKWNFTKEQLPKALKKLDKIQINEVLNTQRCACLKRELPSCAGRFNAGQILSLRAEWIQAGENAATIAAAALKPFNEEQKSQYQQFNKRLHIDYRIGSHKVCRNFYMCALDIYHDKCNEIGSLIIGANVTIAKPKGGNNMPKYHGEDSQYNLCLAFWRYMFNNLSPSPREGVRLFPIYASRKAIYAMDFSVWFLRHVEITEQQQLPNKEIHYRQIKPQNIAQPKVQRNTQITSVIVSKTSKRKKKKKPVFSSSSSSSSSSDSSDSSSSSSSSTSSSDSSDTSEGRPKKNSTFSKVVFWVCSICVIFLFFGVFRVCAVLPSMTDLSGIPYVMGQESLYTLVQKLSTNCHFPKLLVVDMVFCAIFFLCNILHKVCSECAISAHSVLFCTQMDFCCEKTFY